MKVEAAPALENPLLYDTRTCPSVVAGRGEPSVIDLMSPCVYLSLDGREGRLEEGRMQWLIEEAISPRPTFMIRTAPAVFGDPLRVRMALIRLEDAPGARGMRADESFLYFLETREEGKLKAGIPYPLCSSGDLLRYTDRASAERRAVDAMPTLRAGTYELVADLVGTRTQGEKTLAVTRFTVKGD